MPKLARQLGGVGERLGHEVDLVAVNAVGAPHSRWPYMSATYARRRAGVSSSASERVGVGGLADEVVGRRARSLGRTSGGMPAASYSPSWSTGARVLKKQSFGTKPG